ncbi:Binding-protein-dependent transport systems inner membrane component [Roseovarius sp. AK1035]|uniref:ABC transporter permease n=1 Tax=Roseovarius TaxID=74030 RepID=UPI000568C5C0|nr:MULTISPECIES: ABC transporter permease [Roseovarius]AWZ20295.1 Binding-protein-dependent transport systems inner membrane component [Roseovarius sp. AK1035]MBW4974130.1 ABC transporter permease [Roseovarius mucosus]
MNWWPYNLDRIGTALLEHLYLLIVPITIAFVISLAVGIYSAKKPRLYSFIMIVTGILFAIPSLALFALFIPIFGIGTIPAIIGLAAYSLMIMIRNIATGFQNLPPEVIDAAHGMGYGRWRRIYEIELPLALPFIIAGLRIASVTVIGIATIAAYINAGGLGTIIFEGLDQRYPEKILVGGALTSALALSVDFSLSTIERKLRKTTGGAM